MTDGSSAISAAAAAPPDEQRPTLLAVFAAPLICVFAPRRAGSILARAGFRQFVAVFLVAALAFITLAIFAGLATKSRSNEYRRFAQPRIDTITTEVNPGVLSTTTYPVDGEWVRSTRGMGEIAREWIADPLNSPLLWIPPGTVLGMCAVLSAATILGVPWVHRTGRLWNTPCRVFRASAAWLGPLWATIAVIMLVAFSDRVSTYVEVLYQAFRDAVRAWIDADGVVAVGFATLLLLHIWWLTRAVFGARQCLPAQNWPPLCELCGYDLTAQPIESRCPECGEFVRESLGPGERRCGVPWQQDARWLFWIDTASRVLFSPTRFYSELRVRSDDSLDGDHHARRFLRATLMVYAFAGPVWFFLLISASEMTQRGGPSANEIPVLLVFGGMLTWLAAWGVQRGMTAISFVGWVARGGLRDFRWAVHIYCYESAYIGILLMFWALNITNVTLFDFWISKLLDGGTVRAPLLRVLPIEGAIALAGTALILLLWIPRLNIAMKSIRWNNH